MSIGTDGTGLKTNNARSYRTSKYWDPDAMRRKRLRLTQNLLMQDRVSLPASIPCSLFSKPHAQSYFTLSTYDLGCNYYYFICHSIHSTWNWISHSPMNRLCVCNLLIYLPTLATVPSSITPGALWVLIPNPVQRCWLQHELTVSSHSLFL